MGKITATGKRHGATVKVEVEETGGKITVKLDGYDMTETFVQRNMDRIPAIGGSFWPEPMSMLAFWSVLYNAYFDDYRAVILVEGDIGEIPFEDDVVY